MTPKVLSFQSKFLEKEYVIRNQKAALPMITQEYANTGLCLVDMPKNQKCLILAKNLEYKQ